MRFIIIGFMFISTPSFAETCKASYYNTGKITASGQSFNSNNMTAAHKYYKFGTKLKVSRKNKSIIVLINDRGPFVKNRCLDLSKKAAAEIGLLHNGIGNIYIQKLN